MNDDIDNGAEQPITFQRIGGLLPSMGLLPYEGECEEHGASAVHLHPAQPKKEWYCSQCHERDTVRKVEQERLQRNAAGLIEDAQLPEKYRGCTFPAATPPQRDMRLVVKAFKDHIAKGQAWATLVLHGKNGTGKTLVASELGESVIKSLGYSVRFCTAFDMATEIQESYDIYGKTEKGEIDRFSRYRLLIIDEIDKVEERKNARLLLEEVINKRYLAGMPVVAISNQPFNDMEKFVGSRVMSRLHENVFVSDFPWPDFRKQPVKP